jgi:hypothetical protein
MVKVEIVPHGLMLKSDTFAGKPLKDSEGELIKEIDGSQSCTTEDRILSYGEMISYKIWRGENEEQIKIKIKLFPNALHPSTDPNYQGENERYDDIEFDIPEAKSGGGFICWWNQSMSKPETRTQGEQPKEIESKPFKFNNVPVMEQDEEQKEDDVEWTYNSI